MVQEIIICEEKSFSGDYLLSGASEGVLVIWQLESGKTSFVPRLGGSIKHLFTSQDGQYVGISLTSNSKPLLVCSVLLLI